MIKRSKALDERILERLAEGELVTKLCRDETMPSIRQLQRWRRDNAAFDDACWSSEAQGLMIQRSNLIEGMMSAIEEGGPGSSVQIQGLRELLHENGRTAGKLVARMNDRVRVDTNVAHQIVVGWRDSPHDIINALPGNRLPSSADREYIDHLKHPADPAAATVTEKVTDG